MSTKVTVYVTRVTPYTLEFDEDLSFKKANGMAWDVFSDGALEDKSTNDWDGETETTHVHVEAEIDGVLHEEDWD